MADWIESLDKNELMALVPADALRSIDYPQHAAKRIQEDYERKRDYGRSIVDGFERPKRSTKPRKYPNMYEGIKAEIHLLVCTDDKKYAKLRKDLAKHESKATMTIVGIIAASVSSVLGIAVGMCVPFIAYILLVILSVGTNAFCGTLPKAKPRARRNRSS